MNCQVASAPFQLKIRIDVWIHVVFWLVDQNINPKNKLEQSTRLLLVRHKCRSVLTSNKTHELTGAASGLWLRSGLCISLGKLKLADKMPTQKSILDAALGSEMLATEKKSRGNTWRRLFAGRPVTESKYHLATPGDFLHWLGIAPAAFREHVEPLGFCCDDHNRVPLKLPSFQVGHAGRTEPAGVARNEAVATRAQNAGVQECHRLLQDAATYATCVQADALPCEWTAETELLYVQWCRLLESRYQTVRKNFQQNRPDLVLLVQGFEPHNAVARAAALELGIGVLALENTSRSDRLLWDGVTGLSGRNASQQSYWRHKGTVSHTTYQNYCEELIDATKQLKSAEHQSPGGQRRDGYSMLEDGNVGEASSSWSRQISGRCHKVPRILANPATSKSVTAVPDGIGACPSDGSVVARQLSQTEGRPYVLFLGQVYTDSSQVFGLRQWESPLEVLGALADWCEANDFGLVLKLHPKEATGTNPVDNRDYNLLTYQKIKSDTNLVARLDSVDAVIDYDNQLDTYQLIDQAAAAVTVNSQSGLEAAIRGVPVVVCGDANFGGLGFTFDAPQAEFLPVAMKLALESGATRDLVPASVARTDLAREFTYLFFEEYCRPKTISGLLDLVREGLR